ncbi:MAG: di-trans,poly-cis-decaprenylcistransferase [Candidatus Latescibacterota bacterium]|nr:MAG: di-trans,poly-cis-decaprenylcistransferase [Candidatus Latescibacterota bacterium]
MKQNKSKMPKHVGIIMDGNRRWAKKKGLGVVAGHVRAVDEVVEKLIERAGEREVEYLTLWAFSTENWNRDVGELKGIMKLFRRALASKVEKFIKQGARLKMIGDMSRFDEDIQEGMRQAEEMSKNNTKIVVTFALNYGGRDEILRAVEKSKKNGGGIEDNLDTVGMPDPDLIIRTGGEKRLSGFLTWQSVYSELYFTDILFPDFFPEELDKALEEFQNRQRRFGE